MPAKNDLSAFKQKAPQPTLIETPKPVQSAPSPAGLRGRKAKSPDDKESEILALKLTRAEMDALSAKAGMVPKASFVKHILRTRTDLFR